MKLVDCCWRNLQKGPVSKEMRRLPLEAIVDYANSYIGIFKATKNLRHIRVNATVVSNSYWLQWYTVRHTFFDSTITSTEARMAHRRVRNKLDSHLASGRGDRWGRGATTVPSEGLSIRKVAIKHFYIVVHTSAFGTLERHKKLLGFC